MRAREGWRESDGPSALVIFDSLINFIKNCHAYPAVEVRNRRSWARGDLDGIDTEFGVLELTEKYSPDPTGLLPGTSPGRP